MNIADSPALAMNRLFMLPRAHYSVPEFSWKFEVAPGGIAFVGRGLGPQYQNDLIMGGARPFLRGGHLFRFKLTPNRQEIAVDDPRIEDKVADNLGKFEITESESLLFGENFGTITDIRTAPNGNLFLVSVDHGNIYEIHRRGRQALNEQADRGLQQPAHLVQELRGEGAVDHAVVGAHRDVHPVADADVVAVHHRDLAHRAHGEDRALRRVDDGGELGDVEHSRCSRSRRSSP